MCALSIPVSRPSDEVLGFAPASPSVAAAHCAGLRRGLAFMLVLTAMSLAAVCAPAAFEGSHWIEGTAPPASADR